LVKEKRNEGNKGQEQREREREREILARTTCEFQKASVGGLVTANGPSV